MSKIPTQKFREVIDKLSSKPDESDLDFKDLPKLLKDLEKFEIWRNDINLKSGESATDYEDETGLDDPVGDTIYREYSNDPIFAVEIYNQMSPLYKFSVELNQTPLPSVLFPPDLYYYARWDSSSGLSFVRKDSKATIYYTKPYQKKLPTLSVKFFDVGDYLKEYEGFIKGIKNYVNMVDEDLEKGKSANIITQSQHGGLRLLENPIKPFEIDFDKHYNDDVPEFNTIMEEWKEYELPNNRLVIILGDMGSGKTNWIKNYIQNWDGEVIFIPPALAPAISEPQFMDFMSSHKGALLIIEDAEEIMRPRNEGGGTATSNLLNLTDGIMAEFLDLKIIATHNNHKDWVDKALRRRGRCWSQYEFGPLSEKKSKAICDEIGANYKGRAMTLAEIYNQDELESVEDEKSKTIGFA